MDPLTNPPKNSLLKAIVGIWIVWMLIVLSLAGGLIYAAVHFISKFW